MKYVLSGIKNKSRQVVLTPQEINQVFTRVDSYTSDTPVNTDEIYACFFKK